MQDVRQNVLVGLFVLVGIVVLGVLVVIFGIGPQAVLGGAGYPLIIRFRSAAGIRPENQVTIGGIAVGRVDSVEFLDLQNLDAGVKVTAIIEKKYRIPTNSRAVTTEPGLGLGRPPIELIPGPVTGDFLPPGTTIPGEVQSSIQQFVPPEIVSTLEKTATQVGEAAANLSPVLKDMHEILSKRAPADVDRPGGAQGNLSSAMARFDATLKHFNDVLGDPDTKSQLKQAIANVHTITEDGKALTADLKAASQDIRVAAQDAKALVADGRETLARVDGEIASVGRDARGTLERASNLMDALHETARSISQGEGTVGRLVRDGKLYEALILTVERLGQASEEFRLLLKDWHDKGMRMRY